MQARVTVEGGPQHRDNPQIFRVVVLSVSHFLSLLFLFVCLWVFFFFFLLLALREICQNLSLLAEHKLMNRVINDHIQQGIKSLQ